MPKMKNKTISIRVTDELYKRISKLADLDNRTTSSYVANILANLCKKEPRKLV